MPSPPAPLQCPGPLTDVALRVAGWAPGERSEAMGLNPTWPRGTVSASLASMQEAGRTQELPPRTWWHLALRPCGLPEGRWVRTEAASLIRVSRCAFVACRAAEPALRGSSFAAPLCQPCEGTGVLATPPQEAGVRGRGVLRVTARPPQPLQQPSRAESSLRRAWCCGWLWSGRSPGLMPVRACGASW